MYMKTPGYIQNLRTTLKESPALGHGLFYDTMLIVMDFVFYSCLWAPVYHAAKPVDATFRPGTVLAYLILASALAQAAGSLLKAGAMQARLYPLNTGYATFALLKNWKLDAALLMHVFLFFSMLVLAGTAPGIEPIIKAIPRGSAVAWIIFLSLFTPSIAVLAALLVPLTRHVKEVSRNARCREWAGNLLLVFSAVVIQAWFQGILLRLMGSARIASGDTAPVMALGQIIVIFPLFLLVYLPPRIMFLAEDSLRGRTWLRILVINFILCLRFYFFAAPGSSAGY